MPHAGIIATFTLFKILLIVSHREARVGGSRDYSIITLTTTLKCILYHPTSHPANLPGPSRPVELAASDIPDGGLPLVTCILLRYTLKLWSISAYLLKATLHSYTLCGTHTSDFEVKNNIALTVTVCIASFEVISKLQRERLRQSCAKAFS